MIVRLLLIGAILSGSVIRVLGQTTATSGNAADVYMQADELLRRDDVRNICSPATSAENFVRTYPPLPGNWLRMETRDYDLHAQVRELFHEAALIGTTQWPAIVPNSKDQKLLQDLNECRNLANEIADAEEYQSLVLMDEPAAFRSAGDLMRLAESLKNQPGDNLVRLLVANGIDAIHCHRLLVIAANVKITEDPRDLNDLPLATASQWIARLLDHPDAQAEVDQAMKGEPASASTNPTLKVQTDRIFEQARRSETERDFVAMSLAAHVYRYKHGRWPANLDELKTELPRVPLDPWGDGKQTLGYALIAHGLPDGSDRPLVYSRDLLKDGLFFRTDEPQYEFYDLDGSKIPRAYQKHGGQFRDVASWFPVEGANAAATTQPLQ